MSRQFLRTDNTTKRIVKVEFVVEREDYPDLSFLGEYSNKPEAVHIDRMLREDTNSRHKRYFNLGTGDAAYIEEDYKRHEAYNSGDWWMTFCQAQAHISISGVAQVITSGGLGGVESDAGDYLKVVRKDELSDLRGILRDLGFTKRQIDKAFKDCD